MDFDIYRADLSRMNSLTKYPSIPTYHTLDPKNGGLIEETVRFPGDVIATEKIDGTNARILCFRGGMYLLGSREELLYARGDLIGNPALGIVEALKPVAAKIATVPHETLTVYYGEVYGGKVTANSKQYTGEQRVGFRLFDTAKIVDFMTMLERSTADISAWRDSGGQYFVEEPALQEIATAFQIAVTPRVAHLPGSELPQTLDAMYALLQQMVPQSRATLDQDAGGKPEGMVLRSPDRSVIAKVRFEDYERTFKRRKR